MISNDLVVATTFLRDIMIALLCLLCAIFMLKRKFNSNSNSINDSSNHVKEQYFDISDTFWCSHYGCNRAPDPKKYKNDGDKKNWKKKHELSFR